MGQSLIKLENHAAGELYLVTYLQLLMRPENESESLYSRFFNFNFGYIELLLGCLKVMVPVIMLI